ncbi:MAG: SusD/RagB family nutrient-binding outer membrane lipoprotein [Bacteroidales bacterium]
MYIIIKSINKCSLILLLMLAMNSCGDDFATVNTDPNSVTDVDDEYLFANACRQTLRSYKWLQFPFATQYAHFYTGQSNSIFYDRYYDNFTSDKYKVVFEEAYYGPIRLVRGAMHMTEPGGDKENPTRYAMNQVIALANLVQLSDAYGSIPYLEGGLGQDNIMHPAYDPVEAIYKDAINKLGDVVEVLSSAEAKNGYPGADPIFDNNIDNWVRFANSLRLRYAMRVRFADEALAKQTVKNCLSKPLIEEHSQDVKLTNSDSEVEELMNPTYGQYDYSKWKMSGFIIDKLKELDDPRLPIFAKPNEYERYVGLPNGLGDLEMSNWNIDTISDPSDKLVGKASTLYFLTASEVWALRAEAALFGLSTENADQMYEKAIRSAHSQWSIGEDETSNYISSNSYATLTGTTEQKFEQISTQLWLAVMPNGMEAWSNIRRTGYPVLPKRTAPTYDLGVSKGVLPTRLRYPSSEVNINKTNYLQAIKEQGEDRITTKLWWDVKD